MQNHHPPPDPRLTRRETANFGYTAEELLPLTKERAVELWNTGLAIYALHPDNTEAAIEDVAEMDSHDGYFGIEKEDWERFMDRQTNALPIVGKIDYLAPSGEVVETTHYTDKDSFKRQVKEDNYHGVPMMVTAYGKTTLTPESFDPPPQGFRVKKKSVLADLKSAVTKESKKEKTAVRIDAGIER